MTYLFFFLLPVLSLAASFMPASFSTNYEESFISATNGKEKKSFGKIDYKFPGNIRYEKTSPDPTTFVCNPQKSWLYTPPFVPGEQGQVTIQKSSKFPLIKFLDSLKNGLESSKFFTAKYEGKNLVLTFAQSSQKDFGLRSATLVGTKDAKSVTKLSEFEKLILEYQDGKKVNLKFIDLKEETNFPPQHFTFSVPAKTKVTQE